MRKLGETKKKKKKKVVFFGTICARKFEQLKNPESGTTQSRDLLTCKLSLLANEPKLIVVSLIIIIIIMIVMVMVGLLCLLLIFTP